MKFLASSILVHVAVWLALSLRPFQPVSMQRPVEIEILPAADATRAKKQQQFVADPDMNKLQDSLKKLEEKARFLSRRTQRVAEEQIAARTGKTLNSAAQAQRQQQQAPSRPSIEAPSPFGLETDARPQRRNSGALGSKNMQVLLEESAIAEYIPDVKQGGFTSLNTDQFLFYTFYARINEQIRNRWIMNLRTFSQTTPLSIQEALSRRTQITEVEVLLTRDGDYVRSILHRGSDSSGLDRAVVESFVQAQPFPNPPLEIVDPDGFVHLRYAFYLEWRSRSMASGR
jgi:hypothetical protein